MRYEKGRRDASLLRIMEVASVRFRNEGIAAAAWSGRFGKFGTPNRQNN